MAPGADRTSYADETDILLILGAHAFALVLIALCWGSYDLLF